MGRADFLMCNGTPRSTVKYRHRTRRYSARPPRAMVEAHGAKAAGASNYGDPNAPTPARSSRSDHVMPSPQHSQPRQVEQPAQLPPPLLGSLHGYERMAALSDAAWGLTAQNLTENVAKALAIPKKSAAADLAAKRSADESGTITAPAEPVKCSQVAANNRTNTPSQESLVANSENTICIPKTRS